MSFSNKLQNYINAAYPALWIQTFEEVRICKEIVDGLTRPPTKDDPGCAVYEWDCLKGLTVTTGGKRKEFKDTADPLVLFRVIQEQALAEPTENIFVLKDAHASFVNPIKGPSIIRGFKNIIPILKAKRNCVLFVSPVIKIPIELQKDIQMMDYHLPDEVAITKKLNTIVETVNSDKKAKDKLQIETDIREGAIEAAKGMTETEVENAFALAIVENRVFNVGFVKSVFTEKTLQVKKGGLLTHIESNISFDEVGGLSGVKKWIKARKHGFSQKARDYKLPFPKGLGLAGVPGCGKTLISKGIANEFCVPLYQLDLGGLFSKYVGETENNFIQMTKTVDSIGRCVILIDEIEKYLNHGATSGQGDSGTSSRSFGTLLSWLNDRTNPAFIVFTTNNHLILPEALTRKGRFDDLFWVDLPTAEERTDILKVVIKKYGRDVKNFNIPELVDASEEFSGAEVDNAFKDAMFEAFSNDEEVTNKHVLKEFKALIPQAKTNEEAINKMRAAVEGRLRFASGQAPTFFVRDAGYTQTRKVKA